MSIISSKSIDRFSNMNLIVICSFFITFLFTIPFTYCKPKKNQYGGAYPNTFKPRRQGKAQTREDKKKKSTETLSNQTPKEKTNTTSTPTADTPETPVQSSRRTVKTRPIASQEPTLEPTQKTEHEKSQQKSQQLTVSNVRTQEPSRRLPSREPSTAKDKSNMKTARRAPFRRKEYWKDQDEDETLRCVKSIE